MPLDKKLLKILACPDCRGDIKYLKKKRKTNTKKNISSAKSRPAGESLKCGRCQRVFEVKNGIPIMLPKDFQKT